MFVVLRLVCTLFVSGHFLIHSTAELAAWLVYNDITIMQLRSASWVWNIKRFDCAQDHPYQECIHWFFSFYYEQEIFECEGCVYRPLEWKIFLSLTNLGAFFSICWCYGRQTTQRTGREREKYRINNKTSAASISLATSISNLRIVLSKFCPASYKQLGAIETEE